MFLIKRKNVELHFAWVVNHSWFYKFVAGKTTELITSGAEPRKENLKMLKELTKQIQSFNKLSGR